MWLHRYAKLVSASTVLLIVAGGLVTSTGSGLSVPDWPTSYGWSMITFPLRNMVGGIFYEHGHRLIASTVGFLTVILAFWIWRAEPRRRLRRSTGTVASFPLARSARRSVRRFGSAFWSRRSN